MHNEPLTGTFSHFSAKQTRERGTAQRREVTVDLKGLKIKDGVLDLFEGVSPEAEDWHKIARVQIKDSSCVKVRASFCRFSLCFALLCFALLFSFVSAVGWLLP